MREVWRAEALRRRKLMRPVAEGRASPRRRRKLRAAATAVVIHVGVNAGEDNGQRAPARGQISPSPCRPSPVQVRPAAGRRCEPSPSSRRQSPARRGAARPNPRCGPVPAEAHLPRPPTAQVAGMDVKVIGRAIVELIRKTGDVEISIGVLAAVHMSMFPTLHSCACPPIFCPHTGMPCTFCTRLYLGTCFNRRGCRPPSARGRSYGT